MIAEAKRGDRLAIHRLLLFQHDRLVASIARKLPAQLRGSMSAEDICQEAYVSAIRRLDSFEAKGEGAFFGWLCTIADRKLKDAIRGQRAAKRGGDNLDVGAPQADGTSMVMLLDLLAVHDRTPSMSVARHEVIASVQDALDQLPPDYREVLQLRYISGLSAAEAAKRMERGDGAVRMLCTRALARLGEILGDPARLLSSS